MTDSNWMWRLGSAAVFFMTVATGVVFLARSPYQLRVKVVDDSGVLPGAWVAFGDNDVLVADAHGEVVLRGRRYSLDSALFTVTDPRMEPAHLSKTLRAQVSWWPWVNESELQVFLPLLDTSRGALQQQDPQLPELTSSQDHSLDLPMDSAPLLPESTVLNEEELKDVSEHRLFETNPSQWNFLVKNLEQGRTAEWTCLLSGFSTKLCHASAVLEKFSIVRSGIALSDSQTPQEMPTSERGVREVELPMLQPEAVAQAERKVPESSSGLSVEKPLRIEILSEGKAVEGAHVFMSRLRDSRVRELGQTRADGTLQVKIPQEFWGETITVFHNCCVPRSYPSQVSRANSELRLRLELQKGSGVGVVVQQEAYGHLRKVSLFELFSSLGKLAVSGQDGFALYNSSKTPGQILSKVVVRQGRPSEFFVRPDDVPGLQTRPIQFLVAGEVPYLPAMAVLEKSAGRSFQGILKSSGLRRWRRDFMARLMQQTSIRTVVSGEAEARVAAAGESVIDVLARGWQQTQLAGEWDFLLSLEYNDVAQTVRLAASNPDGQIFFEKEASFGQEGGVLPERVSRQFFENFIASFPFEAHVVRQQEDIVELAFSEEENFGLRESTPIALFQQSATSEHSKLSELAALAVVVKGEKASNVRARITHWNSRTRKTRILPDVVRAVKVTQEYYKRESNRNAMSQTSSAGIKKAL